MREKALVRLWWCWVAAVGVVVVGMLAIVIRNESGREHLRDDNRTQYPEDKSLPAWREHLGKTGQWCHKHNCPHIGHYCR